MALHTLYVSVLNVLCELSAGVSGTEQRQLIRPGAALPKTSVLKLVLCLKLIWKLKKILIPGPQPQGLYSFSMGVG